MSTFPTYSKGKKGQTDLFQYDTLPEKLTIQIGHIWKDFLNQQCFTSDFKQSIVKIVYDTICKEKGKKRLHFNGLYFSDDASQIEEYLQTTKETDDKLDVIDIMFFFIQKAQIAAVSHNSYIRIPYRAEEAVNDLNTRFKENGVGYQFTNDKIIRVDNELLHQETVTPALQLLHEPEYANANEEYLKAHEHLRFKRNQECLNECLKSFESTMKIICAKNKWEYKDTDTAKPLINLLLTNTFMPTYHESYLSSLRQLLESNIPTIRNKNSGHGAGTKKRVVPDYLASYMLYVTGATIKLLIDTQNDFDKQRSR